MTQDRRLDFTVGVKADQASFNKLQTQITNLMLSYQKVAAKGGMTEDLKKSMDAAKQLQSILNKSYNSALGSYNMNTFQNELNKAGGSLEIFKKYLYCIVFMFILALFSDFFSNCIKSINFKKIVLGFIEV